MRTVLIFIILSVVATAVADDERQKIQKRQRRPISVEVVEQPFRLIGGEIVHSTGRIDCRALLAPAIPDGKVFVADYVSINVRVANAPADLEGVARVFTGFVTLEVLPSLGKLERAGDLFVLGEQGGFLMIDPTEDAQALALVAEFTLPFPEPVDVSCNGRIDGRLIDAEISAEVPE